MKKHLIFFLVMIFGIGVVFAQDEEAKPKKKKDRPVREVFGSGILIDMQTCVIPEKKTLEMQIMHRFGLIKDNGVKDLWGVYAPSANTRMGLNYSILDNLVVGYGITRKNMYSDFQIKYNVIQQTRKNTIPVTVTLYANMAIDGRNKDVFNTATADSTYKFANRLSYFTQVMVTRKFTDWFTFAIDGNFTHFNSVKADTLAPGLRGMNHDIIGIGFMGRFKFSPQSSIVFHYTIPLEIKSISENSHVINKPKPNFGIGYQVATATHAFEIFITISNSIIPQDTYMYNTAEWGDFRIGFNITRLWGF